MFDERQQQQQNQVSKINKQKRTIFQDNEKGQFVGFHALILTQCKKPFRPYHFDILKERGRER